MIVFSMIDTHLEGVPISMDSFIKGNEKNRIFIAYLNIRIYSWRGWYYVLLAIVRHEINALKNGCYIPLEEYL